MLIMGPALLDLHLQSSAYHMGPLDCSWTTGPIQVRGPESSDVCLPCDDTCVTLVMRSAILELYLRAPASHVDA